MAAQKNLSSPKIGMNRSASPHLLQEGEYAFQLNGNSYDEGGEKFNLTDEHSNILATKFKAGFKFVGGKNHVVRNKTYIFLTNPTTGISEIGCITNTTNFTYPDDTQTQTTCKDCPSYSSTEATPLENQTQVAHQIYETLLEDSCNMCLGFDINYPIVNIIIKEQNIGTTLFWTSTPGNNEFRYIELDDLAQYRVQGTAACGGTPTATCLDCDKLRVFPLYEELKADNYSRALGGSLRRGSYEILGAYSDQLGNELTSYMTLTPIIPIFDEANIITEQVDDNAETNFSIKVELSNVDLNFQFYKIAVRYYTSRGVFTSFVESVHNTTDRTIILSDNNGESIANTRLAVRRPFIESVDGATVSNNILILNGVREREPINLQPVMNLAGLGVKWMSFRAKEDLYANANSYKFLGYNRDENVALAIDFGFRDGYRTNLFNLIPRPATTSEMEIISTGNDFQSITTNVGNCDSNLRNRRWQFYNTATETGVCPSSGTTPTTSQTEAISTFTEVNVPSATAGQISLTLDQVNNFTDLSTYIEDNLNDPAALGPIAPFVDLTQLTGFNEVPTLPATTCTAFALQSPETIQVGAITGEDLTLVFPPDSSSYASIRPPSNVNLYEITGSRSRLDHDFSFSYNSQNVTVGLQTVYTIHTRQRVQGSGNTTCQQAQSLQRITTTNLNNIYGQFFHENQGATSMADLQVSTVTMSVTQGTVNSTNGIFTNRLHRNALWFTTRTFDRNRFYINLSSNTRCNRETITINGANVRFGVDKTSLVRVSIFNSCSATSPIHSEIVDLTTSSFITVTPAIISALTTDTLYISVETSIRQSTGLGPTWRQNDWVDDSDPLNPVLQNSPTIITTFIANLPCGAWNIVDRNEIPTSGTIAWTSIALRKRQRYTSTCTFNIPILQDCEPVPYKYGELGYYQSTSTYPDNSELYDSSGLTINKSRITNTDLLSRLSVYRASETPTQITLSAEANFRCKNVRHYKMPDNQISPFIGTDTIASNSDSIISPLGFSLDGEVVSNMLDVAVDNNLITQEQRNNIVDFKIYRADSTLDRSVVASGLVFNTKSYQEEGETINYFNYPFNSLGTDKYYPSNTDGDFKYIQAISPEFDYFRPSLPDEMSIQGYMFGKSNSRVVPVEDHSRMVILGSQARSLANTLAILEVTTEIIIQAAQASSNAQVWFVGGFSNGGSFGTPAFVAAGVIAAVSAIEGFVSRVGRIRLEWERSFENLGAPYNFGYYTAAGSNYNYLRTLQTDGDRLRGLSVRRYLKSGMLSVSDTVSGEVVRLNNIDREEAPFFSLGDFPIQNLNSEYTNFDNSTVSPNFSSQILSSEIGCHQGKSPEEIRNIASPYIAFKNFAVNQYGTLDSIKWIDTTYCIPITERGVCTGILGGDTFISRHSKKRKTRIFETDLLGSADLTPFPYRFNSNYGDPRYFIDYKVNSEVQTGSRAFPNIFYNIQFDCDPTLNSFYVTPPGKFYLYSIAFANFLCETRVNTNFRNARREPWNQFYPQNTDYEAITQPTTVALTRPENYFYNRAYLQTNNLNTSFILPEYYSREDEARRAYNRNSGIYSLPDVNENSITEPWLLYRPNDAFTLESTYGDLINIKGIESDQILMYFENAMQLQNAVNQFTDGSTQYNSDLGNGGMFAKRALTLRTTDIGYGGTQSKNTLSCEFGHFHADMHRGQVFRYVGGTDLEEISRYSNGKPNGMDVWFKEHLPLKFARLFPNYRFLDNPYNGTGIHWGYDSKYRRVILTKKDYIVRSGVSLTYDETANTFNGLTLQQQIANGNLVDVSWTLTFKPETGSWESYMSYTPNYYINHTDYFQSGINSEDATHGLWSHLLTNRSYRVFYGQKFPYIIEYPEKNQYFSKRIESISWNAQLRRHHNEYDFAPIEDNPFTSVTIFNNYENSGRLSAVRNTGARSQLSRYPITNPDNTQDVLISYDNYRYNLNYFYNRVRSNRNNEPIWNWDANQIQKTINPRAVSFYGKKTLERLKGNFFMIRLERDGNTNYDLDFRWSEQTVNQDL